MFLAFRSLLCSIVHEQSMAPFLTFCPLAMMCYCVFTALLIVLEHCSIAYRSCSGFIIMFSSVSLHRPYIVSRLLQYDHHNLTLPPSTLHMLATCVNPSPTLSQRTYSFTYPFIYLYTSSASSFSTSPPLSPSNSPTPHHPSFTSHLSSP